MSSARENGEKALTEGIETRRCLNDAFLRPARSPRRQVDPAEGAPTAARGDALREGCAAHVREIVVPSPPDISRMWEAAARACGVPTHVGTVVALQALPPALDAGRICDLLDRLGFAGDYNAVRGGHGHMVVNFLCPARAQECIAVCDGAVMVEQCRRWTCSAGLVRCRGDAFVAECMAMHSLNHLGSTGGDSGVT
mmetsp:Transcript_67317/g.194712  ORF Transcript_67317/g.194712 Transcript_67317/m.194712 type:complete len:196 (+) Transcript_67317:100-687(+)|eukprot:CAMPEP_0176032296 /NCGR_PEP_ID=MMETSP0120_2-20121206/15938_1 /TAXON_ID=160619 /ORGANISM="Kryptoperidinium foliaceum, Strain CCMP 1326" /LENGTH=195 /DNA_ID=CAMNT_0017365609 /DNA_START=65 /DNA_END=652 /DNA_ORIENTATION=+